MRLISPRLCTSLAAIAVASLSGCGGGGGSGSGDAAPEEASSAGARMNKLAFAVMAQPPNCDTTTLALANIDFVQAGWTGDHSPSQPVAVQTPVAAVLDFTDASAWTHTASWSWGDGLSSVGNVVESGGSGSTSASHTFAGAGVHTVTADVTGSNCTRATTTRQIVVYDPSGGFVTGGGWIESPAGAYAADPTMTGRANFGFVSKYLKGATVPSGQTEFQLQAARLNFHSKNYEWLVVAGARAQYKGTGSINGVDGFRFLLTAVDGDLLDGKTSDRVRIKIWHADGNGSDVVDYDNQLAPTLEGGTSEGTAIRGGSIVIHK